MKNQVGFDYHVTESDSFGALNGTTKLWTGMIGEVANNHSQLAAQAFTITSDRKKVS